MQQIIIRHLSGQRANQVDQFPADFKEDLVAGRDGLASIHFDSQADDLVSRQHVKIVRDSVDPGGFRLIDLQSRNGTYVNRRRVFGSTFLNHNDRIQLGASGPEFRFELDPPPQGYREEPSESDTRLVPQTREVFSPSGSTRELGLSGSRTVGRATVERMLDDTFGLLKRESNKILIVGLACLIAVVLVGVATWSYIQRSAKEQNIRQQAAQEQVQQSVEQTRKDVIAASSQIHNDVSQLNSKVGQSEQKTQAAINAMEQKVSAIKRAQDREAAERRLHTGSRQPEGAPVNVPALSTSFGENLDRVDALVRQNKYSDALAVSRQMMRLEPNRYEGYFYGGVSALETQQAELARQYLKQAEAKAPAEKRSLIQPLLATAQQLSAKEK